MPRAIGRKQDIIDAAIALLAAHGPAGLTASALAKAAGVSKANLFHHFASLDDVVIAAFEQFILGMETLRGAPPDSLRAWLLALGTETESAIGESAQLTSAYFGFIARAPSDVRLKGRIAELIGAAETAFAATLAAFMPDRSTAEIAALATLILLAGDGLAVHIHLFPERAARYRAAWEALVDTIAPREITS